MRRGIQRLLIVCLFLALAPQAGFAQFNSPFGDGNAPDPEQASESSFAPQTMKPQTMKPQTMNTGATTSAPRPLALDGATYKLGPEDVVDISVYGVPDLSVSAKVGADGNLQLPLLGATPAAGKTADELQQDLTARLGADYLQNPQVSVLVKEFNSRSVIVTGAIKNGVYPLKGQTTLLQLVAGAGGFSQESDSTVLILRPRGGRLTAAKFDVSSIEKGQAQDPILQAGDRIVAGESAIKKGYGLALKALGIAGRFALF